MKTGSRNSGDEPQTIRYRSYYRAVKSGKKWAVSKEKLRKENPMSWILWWFYTHTVGAEYMRQTLYGGNPFLCLVSKPTDWSTPIVYFTLPKNLGTKRKRSQHRNAGVK